MEEVKECLHCGNGQPYYCEECYQELITENSKLQLKLKAQQEHYEEVINNLLNKEHLNG